MQADYVFVPPFQASVRYQQLNPGDPTAALTKIFTANLSFLAYANVKLMVEYNDRPRELQELHDFHRPPGFGGLLNKECMR